MMPAEASSPIDRTAMMGLRKGLHRIGAHAPVREVAPLLILGNLTASSE